MGQCFSREDAEAKRNHVEVENQLKKAKREMEKEEKVLLLGPGDSGKTTVMKQMRLITNASFTARELESYRQLVFSNLVTGMRALVECLPEVGLSIDDDAEALQSYQLITESPDVKDEQPFFQEYLPHFKFLWQHPVICEGFNRCRQFAVPDNVPYFYSALDRLFLPDYQPTHRDIVHTRARTSGIIETLLTISDGFTTRKLPDPDACPTVKGPKRSTRGAKGYPRSSLSAGSTAVDEEGKENSKGLFRIDSAVRNLRIVDVGGQKSERRKWIHCFQDVTAILFLVSLSGYDQCLVEERTANQMSDAMSVWENICTMEWFQDTSMILFLNKEDLFNEKVQHSSIRRYFPDYDGDSKDAEAGKEYFKRRFIRIAQKGSSQWRQQQQHSREHNPSSSGKHHARRQLYTHFTTAVDISLIHAVMVFVKDTVLQSHLESASLL